jgi:hypothetical protein
MARSGCQRRMLLKACPPYTRVQPADLTGAVTNPAGIPQIDTTARADLTVTKLVVHGATVSYRINDIGTGAAVASTTGIYLSSDSTITTADTLLTTVCVPKIRFENVDGEAHRGSGVK